MQKSPKMTETLVHVHSCESTRWGLSNEYQHDRVCILVRWTKVASASEGLSACELSCLHFEICPNRVQESSTSVRYIGAVSTSEIKHSCSCPEKVHIFRMEPAILITWINWARSLIPSSSLLIGWMRHIEHNRSAQTPEHVLIPY